MDHPTIKHIGVARAHPTVDKKERDNSRSQMRDIVIGEVGGDSERFNWGCKFSHWGAKNGPALGISRKVTRPTEGYMADGWSPTFDSTTGSSNMCQWGRRMKKKNKQEKQAKGPTMAKKYF